MGLPSPSEARKATPLAWVPGGAISVPHRPLVGDGPPVVSVGVIDTHPGVLDPVEMDEQDVSALIDALVRARESLRALR